MNKKILLISFIFFVLSFYSVIASPIDSYVGERLTYKITWFGIYAGDAYISFKKIPVKGRMSFYFKAKLNSAKWFSSIYYVEDIVTSVVDLDTLRPLEIKVDYKEGKHYTRNAQYLFDYKKNKIVVKGDPKLTERDFSSEFVGMFVGFFLLRNNRFVDTNSFSKVVHDGRKRYKLTASLLRKENISTILGNKECLVINPGSIKADLLGKSQEPRELELYLTNDDAKIPVLAVGEIKIGSIKVTLKKYRK